MKTRLALVGGAVAVTGLLAGTAPLAFAGPKCSNTGATAAHTVEDVANLTPAGPVTEPVIHDTVEPVLCSLPLP